jgi:DNA-binding transcriptional MerR regulator
MSARVAIGDFSRMTQLSVKALRHYHDVGVLVPAAVDPATGYRYCDVEQVPVAHIVPRLRDLGMPLADVRAVLQAPDLRTRNEVIVAHLARMETQLALVESKVGLYPGELFEVEVADVVVFVPVARPVPPSGRTRMVEVPGAELAVALHEGPFAELDRTYGALGTYVAERELAVAGPIREYYPTQSVIEVGWPILPTARDPG